MFVYQRVSFKHEITETSSIHGGFASVFFHPKKTEFSAQDIIVDTSYQSILKTGG